MAVNHKSPQSSSPALTYKTINTTTWGSGGNSVTITDSYVHSNSAVFLWVTGTTPQNGRWAIDSTTTDGQFTITSTDPESSTLAISYIVL